MHRLRILASLAALCLLAASGCAPGPATGTATPPRSTQLAASAWSAVSLPVPANRIRSYAVSPTDLATLFACASSSGSQTPGATASPIALWRTHDAGRQ
jgi:hypothetical protein